jgi:hypothetical protein
MPDDATLVIPTWIQVGTKMMRITPAQAAALKLAAATQQRLAKAQEIHQRHRATLKKLEAMRAATRPSCDQNLGRRRISVPSRPLGHARRRGTNLRTRGSSRTTTSSSSGGGGPGEPSEPEPGDESRHLIAGVARV